jgi:hypothetical protein
MRGGSGTHASDWLDSTAKPTLARPAPDAQLYVFHAALPNSRGEAYLRHRGVPLLRH